jgi:4-diphosphocytidyl-2-C-methyl-D-erythritol kinase
MPMRLVLSAPAKINLTLDVLGRRADGYHEIASVIVRLELHDTIAVEPAGALEVECHGAAIPAEQNLALKAAQLLQEVADCRQGARIYVTKRIPIAAGLAGGSSDAAATLLALARLWGLEGHLPVSLSELAARLGSDVPFFLNGPVALAEGRGERLTPLPPLPPRPVVLLKPPFGLSTAKVYGALRLDDFSDGSATQFVAQEIRAGRWPPPERFFNALERPASRLRPELQRYCAAFLEAGAGAVHLSGSGPALYSLFDERGAAEAVYQRLRQAGFEAYLTTTA